MNPESMNADRPISTRSEDRLERNLFADRLAKYLVLGPGEPSIVVGIEGKWGEGKTSCINMIRESLNEHNPKPIIIEYAPWLVSQIDSLVEGFLVELAQVLGRSDKGAAAKQAAVSVLSFAKFLAPIKLIPGVEPWGSIIERVLNSVGGAVEGYIDMAALSLNDRKRRLEKSLEEINVPIVVIIDDIDRLSPDDVRIAFQMLKSITNFSRVSYLVAYDPVPVEKALSFNGEYVGRSYLEKIIQVSVKLPRLGLYHRKQLLEHTAEVIEKSLREKLQEWEQKQMLSIIGDMDVLRLIDTPRTVVRLQNRMRISTQYASGEVCIADLLLFELISLRFPEVRNWVQNNAALLIIDSETVKEFPEGGLFLLRKMGFKDRDAERNELKESLFKESGVQSTDQELVLSCLGKLFPRLSQYGVYSHVPRINEICRANALLKVLHSGLNSITPSSRSLRNFLTSPSDRDAISNDWITNRTIDQCLLLVAKEAQHFSEINRSELVIDIMRIAKSFQGACIGSDHTASFAQLVYSIAEGSSDCDEYLRILCEAMKCPGALSVSKKTLMLAIDPYVVYRNGVYSPEDYQPVPTNSHQLQKNDVKSLVNLWVDSVREYAKADLMLEKCWDPMDILWRWSQLAGNGDVEVSNYLDEYAQSDERIDRLLSILECNAPRPPFVSDSLLDKIRRIIYENPVANELIKKWDGFERTNSR